MIFRLNIVWYSPFKTEKVFGLFHLYTSIPVQRCPHVANKSLNKKAVLYINMQIGHLELYRNYPEHFFPADSVSRKECNPTA
jgi:hypothetical protein